MARGFEKEKGTFDRPVAKPDLPLPKIFEPSSIGTLPTRRRAGDSLKNQRAHFYRKDFTDTGSPVYDFYITTEDTNNHTQH